MENRDILPRKKMESITYGAQCLVKQTMPCAECPIHAEGHEYPGCLHELGQMILDADAGEVGGMTGLIIREKNTRIENMGKIIEDRQERIDIMAADMPIHCKDCKHGSLYCTEDTNGETLYECNRPEIGDMVEVHSWKWFCAEGEQKEDDPNAHSSD